MSGHSVTIIKLSYKMFFLNLYISCFISFKVVRSHPLTVGSIGLGFFAKSVTAKPLSWDVILLAIKNLIGKIIAIVEGFFGGTF